MKNVADIYAISPMQRLMLLHAKTTVYSQDVLFNQIVYAIKGTLRTAAYQQAWQLVIDRHSALRTIFVWQDGKEPVQVVREKVSLPWVEHDWRELPASEQERELESLLVADRATGFDLLKAPLMRINLIRFDDLDYRLVWSSHHLIIDRWCIGIIFEELKDAYEAFTSNTFPELAPPPRYRDYIALLAEQDADAAQAYWREQLHNVRAQPLALRTGPADGTAKQEAVKFSVQGDDWAALRQFANNNNLTLGTLVSAAWALVLGAATNTDDTLFGLTVSGRPAELPEVGRTVGCFINNVPMRIVLEGNQPVVAWLQALQEKQMDLRSYEYASPAQIQSWSSLERKSPLFDTLLVQQAPVRTPMPADMSIEYVRGGMQTGYPISLGVVPGSDRLRFALNYDREHVPQEMTEQMASAIQQVLLAMAADEEALLLQVRAQIRIDIPAEREIKVASGDISERPFIPPRTASERALAKIWAELLDKPRIGVEDRFYQLGGDSIRAIQLLTVIEQRMQKEVPISLLFGDPTLARMAAAIAEHEEDLAKDPVLVLLNEKGTRPPVFFTHGVSGSLIWLTNVLPLLEPDQPAYGLQSVGLHPDSEPDTTIEAMATRYLRAIQSVQPSGPYYLGGFCFGGVVAYEIARQLEQRGEKTALLAIIDGFLPDLVQRKRPFFDPLRLQIIRESAPYWVQGYEEFGGWQLRERVFSKFGRGHGPQQDNNQRNTYNDPEGSLDVAFMADYAATKREIRRQIVEIHHRAADAYSPQAYGSQITLFHARLLGVRHALSGPIDPRRGWDRLAKGGVSTRPVAGSHTGLLKNPNVSDLAAKLNEALQTTMAASQLDS